MIHVDKIERVHVRGRAYPITIAGNGVPCLVVGNGIIVQRTLSQHFKDVFEVYATDLYWDHRYDLPNPTALTFDQLLEDIVEMGTSLALEKPILFGFSAFGLVAVELAKRYPHFAHGIIMVGTPVNANQEVVAMNHRLFDTTADARRKAIDTYRRALVSQEDLSGLPTHERFKREYMYRDAPRYWHDPEFDCTPLWEGIELGPLLDHFFTSLIPAIDIRKGLEKIDIPVYLAAGASDYDCCPVQGWSALTQVPPKFTMEVFTHSGHYPHYEEEALFDERLIRWVKSIL